MGWEDEEVIIWACESAGCRFVVAVSLVVWLAGLLVSCKIWQRYVDVLGIRVSRWAEDVVLGKREVEVLAGVLGEIPRPNWTRGVSTASAPQVSFPHRTDPEKFS